MNREPSSQTAAEAPPLTFDPRLVVVTPDPFNAEAPLDEQLGLITPNSIFYVRNRFAIPRTRADEWQLTVGGEVSRPFQMTYDQLRALPSRALLVTLECAGNGRSGLTPPAEGEPWQYGAVSTAEWTGVPLAAVLGPAGLTGRAREILIQGVDSGKVDSSGRVVPFARSLDLETAFHPDTLLAYAMNGDPLPAAHGFPVRLVVPGWYGMASIKWVAKIEAIAEPFVGFFQTERYIMEHPELGQAPEPLTRARTRSLILSPAAGAELPRGEHRVRGLAWSGVAPIERVEVSADGGESWQTAELVSGPERYAWRRWEYSWRASAVGPAALRSRAFDADGNTQPVDPEWNRLGYANNAVQVIEVSIS